MSATPGGLSGDQLSGFLDAITAIGREVRLDRMLQRVIESATELVGARYGALGILDPERRELADFLYVGIARDEARAIGPLPRGTGVLGELIRDPRPLRLDDVALHPRSGGFPPNHPTMTTFLGVPVRVRGEIFGNLYLADKGSGTPFTPADERLAEALASVAGVAVENVRLHQRVSDLARIEERERIGRELHDTVIQRIFSIGLALQGVSRQVGDDAGVTLQRAAADLDETVQQIRESVLRLDEREARRVRAELTDLFDELGEQFDLDLSVSIDHRVDDLLGRDEHTELADTVFAVAHGLVSAVAAGGGATAAEVDVSAAEHVAIEISSDGALDEDDGRFVKVRERAEAGGTSLEVEQHERGTRLRWRSAAVGGGPA